MYVIFLTLILDFHAYAVILYFLNNPSVIFLTQLHSISQYCRNFNTPHHPRLIEIDLTHVLLPLVVQVGNWEGPHTWNSLGPLFI